MDDIHKETGWECPVDWTRVNALCQLHEIYIEEKRWRMDEVAGPSWLLDKRGPGEKGKEKVSAFRMASGYRTEDRLTKSTWGADPGLQSGIFAPGATRDCKKRVPRSSSEPCEEEAADYRRIGRSEGEYKFRSNGQCGSRGRVTELPLHKATLDTCDYRDLGTISEMWEIW